MRRRNIAALCLLLLGGCAKEPAWRQVSDDGFSKIYIDPQSKIVERGVVKVDAMTDYDPKSLQAKDFGLAEKGLSEIETVFIDCATQKYRSGGGAWRKDHLGRGAVSRTYDATPAWKDVPDFYRGLAKEVCAKR
jgi:hypothetical protein